MLELVADDDELTRAAKQLSLGMGTTVSAQDS